MDLFGFWEENILFMVLTENEIRPEHLMAEQKRLYEEDIKLFIRQRGRFVVVSCPACESKDYEKVMSKYTLSFVKCKKCRTIFTNPRPGFELLSEYYENSKNYEYWAKYIFPASEKARREKIFVPRVNRVLEMCKKYKVKTDTLLEVGAGFGIFCEEMKKKGAFKRIIAVEPTQHLAQLCRDKGLEVIEKLIEDVDMDENSVDVIANFETIEHLFSPKEFILACKKFLKKGGLFVVTCPNFEGFDVMTLREKSDTVDFEHINYFNPDSLGLLLKNCGFEVLEALTPGELDAELVRKKVLAGEYSLEGQEFLKTILIDRWEEVGATFQKFLKENKLSSNMWLVARKK